MASITFPRGALKALATVTKPTPNVFLLSMHNLPDNRLTPDFIKLALLPALDHIELEYQTALAQGKGEASLVLTGERSKNKFFSNGLQLELVAECPGFFRDYYFKLMSKLMTFPVYTVSAINGHYFAGGFCLSQCTDWRVVKAERAWGCMNEVDFGAPLPAGMAAVLNNRLSSDVVRKIMLTAHRFTADEALAAGIVDEVVPGADGETVIARAIEVATSRQKLSATGVLGMMKERLYAPALATLLVDESMGSPAEVNAARFAALKAQSKL